MPRGKSSLRSSVRADPIARPRGRPLRDTRLRPEDQLETPHNPPINATMITNTDPPLLAPAVSGPSSESSNSEASVSDLSLEQLRALIWAEVQSAHGSLPGPVSAAAPVPPLVPGILHIYVYICFIYEVCILSMRIMHTVRHCYCHLYGDYNYTLDVVCHLLQPLLTINLYWEGRHVAPVQRSRYIRWVFRLRFLWHCVCRRVWRWSVCMICVHVNILCICACVVHVFLCV